MNLYFQDVLSETPCEIFQNLTNLTFKLDASMAFCYQSLNCLRSQHSSDWAGSEFYDQSDGAAIMLHSYDATSEERDVDSKTCGAQFRIYQVSNGGQGCSDFTTDLKLDYDAFESAFRGLSEQDFETLNCGDGGNFDCPSAYQSRLSEVVEIVHSDLARSFWYNGASC